MNYVRQKCYICGNMRNCFIVQGAVNLKAGITDPRNQIDKNNIWEIPTCSTCWENRINDFDIAADDFVDDLVDYKFPLDEEERDIYDFHEKERKPFRFIFNDKEEIR